MSFVSQKSPEILKRDLAKNSGASLIGLMSNGVGAVARDVKSKLADIVSVMDYIPVAEHAAIYNGTSIYDVTADIQKAVNLSSNKVFVPVGLFNITSIFLRDGTSIIGSGLNTVFRIIGIGSVGFKSLANDTNLVADQSAWVTMSDFQINFTDNSQIGVSYVGLTRTTSKNIYITMGLYGATGFKCVPTVVASAGGPAQWYNNFYNCYIIGTASAKLAGAIGWDIGGTAATDERATAWGIFGGRTNNCKTGVWIKGAVNVNFYNHTTEGNDDNWIIGNINAGERKTESCNIYCPYVEGGITGFTFNAQSMYCKVLTPFMTSLTGASMTDLGFGNHNFLNAADTHINFHSWVLEKNNAAINPVIKGAIPGLNLDNGTGNIITFENNSAGNSAAQQFIITNGVDIFIQGGAASLGFFSNQIIHAQGTVSVSTYYGVLNPPANAIGKDGDMYVSTSGGGKLFQRRLGAWISV